MVLNLVLIGLAITLEPFPLTAFILLLSAEKGTFKGLAFVLGWLACLVIVLAAVLLTTQGKPPAPSTAPSTAALAIKLALGVALVLYAARKWRRRGIPSKPPTWMARLDGCRCGPPPDSLPSSSRGRWWRPAPRPSPRPNCPGRLTT